MKAHLDGYQEVPPISTAAKFAHIHFGQFGVDGGVSAFLCGGSKPACPPSGEVTGTIAASDVVGPAAQGIAAGEIDELIAAIRHGVTYVNIHTTRTETVRSAARSVAGAAMATSGRRAGMATGAGRRPGRRLA